MNHPSGPSRDTSDLQFYLRQSSTLDGLIEVLENSEHIAELHPDVVIILPINGNEDNTDEDSGEEDDVYVNNVSRTELLAEVKKYDNSSDYDRGDNLQLPYNRNKTKAKEEKKCH
ncbi:hypothetical protein FQR65_LT10685 [Abscondita terminalis]|nr:hypothetical protein FQR65_LT10685 [Abscondita terminalis]